MRKLPLQEMPAPRTLPVALASCARQPDLHLKRRRTIGHVYSALSESERFEFWRAINGG